MLVKCVQFPEGEGTRQSAYIHAERVPYKGTLVKRNSEVADFYVADRLASNFNFSLDEVKNETEMIKGINFVREMKVY